MARLPPPFEELWKSTLNDSPGPFLQAVTDVKSPKAVFGKGRILLCGDALCRPRPHTASSTSQAASHALLLHDALAPSLSRTSKNDTVRAWSPALPSADFATGGPALEEPGRGEQWESRVLENARKLDEAGRAMGQRNQFGHHPLADNTGLEGVDGDDAGGQGDVTEGDGGIIDARGEKLL